MNTCTGSDNPPGSVKVLRWPPASNTGHRIEPGQTLRFEWSGEHNVVQTSYWDGPRDPEWPDAIRSGPLTTHGTFDWNVGGFPCGYRPGIYYFVDHARPEHGPVSVSVTEPEGQQEHFGTRPCSELARPDVFGGRYAAWSDRPDCTLHEVNNFQTETHYDWVPPILREVKQGDLVLFRWTGYHNVVQVHDVHQDQPVGPDALVSGPRTHCVGGPNYSCANGPPSLGEFLFDTKDWRPGMIHISDQCAYNSPDCAHPASGPPSATGMNMQFLLSRGTVPKPQPGSCCALKPGKGQACRVVELYNDSEGTQFHYNTPVNRGDLVRFRWAGTLQIIQVQPNADGTPSRTPRAGGYSMPAPVECVPGPNWSCIGRDASEAEFIFDVDAALAAGQFERGDHGLTFFTFHAFGENTDGFSSQDSGIRLYLAKSEPYSPNEACQ